MSRKVKNMDGMIFGHLTVVRADGKTNAGKTKYFCNCSCGKANCKKQVSVDGRDLTKGNTKSCGAKSYENIQCKKLYNVWQYMLTRCNNENCKDYKHYGSRGIVVSDEWYDFLKFESWALENGYKEGLTIDRTDVNGDYESSNCRWITKKEQNRNKRNNIHILYNGKDRLLVEVAEELGLEYTKAYYNYKNGSLDVFLQQFEQHKEIDSIGVLSTSLNINI